MANNKLKLILGIIACILVVAFDAIAAVLGIKAEEAQDKAKHVRIIFFECKKRSQDAFVLGFAAAAFLFAAHVITHLVGFCLAPNEEKSKKKSSNKCFSLACLTFAWLVFLMAVTILAIAANSNNESKISCGVTLHNYLYVGGMMCFAHLLFSLGFAAGVAGALPF